MLPLSVICAGALTFIPEVIVTILYMHHHSARYLAAGPDRHDVRMWANRMIIAETTRWLSAFHVHLKALSILAAIIGSSLLISRQSPEPLLEEHSFSLGHSTYDTADQAALAALGFALFWQVG